MMAASSKRIVGRLFIFSCLLCIFGILLAQFTAVQENSEQSESATFQSTSGYNYFHSDLLLEEEEEDECIHIYQAFTRTHSNTTGSLNTSPHGPEFARDYADYLERDLPPPSLG